MLFTRYGRVGEVGVISREIGNIASSIAKYNKKFKEKTSKTKGYTALQMKTKEQSGKPKEEKEEDDVNSEIEKSKIPVQVQNLMNFIYDKKMMEKQVKSQGYDPSKVPVDQLSDDTVKEGYKYLREIEKIMDLKPNGDFTAQQRNDLAAFSSKFYTYIPHDFGRSSIKHNIIDDSTKFKAKLDLIDSLINI